MENVRAVDLMVAHCVIEELDQHKTATNKRRRDRARAALKLVENASSREPDFALLLRNDPVRVRVVISRAPRFNWATHPDLDPASADDRLVAEAASFGSGAEVFSHDTGPRIRARTILKIRAYEPPADWLLPAELTDDQRKINKLERDLEQALNRHPKIDAGFEEIDEATSEIRVIRPMVQPLDPQLAQQLADEYLARHPPASFSPWPYDIWEDDVQRYCSKYSSFEEKVREYFVSLHEAVKRAGSVVAIDYFVKNHSGVAAEGLRIEFDIIEGAGSLLATREDASVLIGSFKSPQPPDRPRPSWDYGSMGIHTPEPRDPVAFYWFDRPRIGVTHSALQCQDFRAMREFRDCVLVLPSYDLPIDLAIRLHVEATNLPRPLDLTAKLTVVEKAVEWDDIVVQAMLADCVGAGMI